jgi:hypothetical protein
MDSCVENEIDYGDKDYDFSQITAMIGKKTRLESAPSSAGPIEKVSFVVWEPYCSRSWGGSLLQALLFWQCTDQQFDHAADICQAAR